MLYFDIHTHKVTTDSDVVSIYNRIIHGREGQDPFLPDYISAGIHPWYISDNEFQFELLEKTAELKQTKAIGECGFDKLAATPFDLQWDVFSRQIALSEKLGKPLIIHCVKAWDELIAIKKKWKTENRWIIHGFRGNGTQAEQLLNQGLSLSFGEHFHPEAVKTAFKRSLFLETDESDLSIQMIYQTIAQTLSIPLEELVGSVERNVRKSFSI